MPQQSTIPPPLPPSVEAAYKRKCLDLRKRLNEVSTLNNSLRTRKARLQRGVFKLRLERAFLLDQLGKRTDLQIEGEESEGSERGPPTPKEKPLRIKRGHRRPSLLATIRDPAASSAAAELGLGHEDLLSDRAREKVLGAGARSVSGGADGPASSFGGLDGGASDLGVRENGHAGGSMLEGEEDGVEGDDGDVDMGEEGEGEGEGDLEGDGDVSEP